MNINDENNGLLQFQVSFTTHHDQASTSSYLFICPGCHWLFSFFTLKKLKKHITTLWLRWEVGILKKRRAGVMETGFFLGGTSWHCCTCFLYCRQSIDALQSLTVTDFHSSRKTKEEQNKWGCQSCIYCNCSVSCLITDGVRCCMLPRYFSLSEKTTVTHSIKMPRYIREAGGFVILSHPLEYICIIGSWCKH